MVKRRLGKSPQARGCLTDTNCPDVFELSDGRFAIIGTDMTEEFRGILPSDAGVGPKERVIVVPREVLIDVRADIPAS